jgi:uncharacterized protein YceH (UPF0502 family)
MATELLLTADEIRVLGALIEKDITTPEYYPLSLNALVNACNQKSNREPVMVLNEDAVRHALESLQPKRLAGPASSADSRVPKFEHRLQEVFNFDRRETAILCVLLLRGAQTLGELRGRTERMHHFETLDEVQATIQKLASRDPSLVTTLPRQPGTKEARFTHRFAGEPSEGRAELPAASTRETGGETQFAHLEGKIAALQCEIAELREQWAAFRKRFE